MNDGRDTAPGQSNSGCQSGKTGTDDVNGLRHQMNA
jgi:hypothetical protein